MFWGMFSLLLDLRLPFSVNILDFLFIFSLIPVHIIEIHFCCLDTSTNARSSKICLTVPDISHCWSTSGLVFDNSSIRYISFICISRLLLQVGKGNRLLHFKVMKKIKIGIGIAAAYYIADTCSSQYNFQQ